MKMSSMVGICSAMALCLAVGTAQAGPGAVKANGNKVVKAKKTKKMVKRPASQRATAGAELTPVRVAPVKLVNGKPVLAGEWQPYIGAGQDANWVLAYDCYESDDTGFPIGAESCDPSYAGDTRFYSGPTYYSPSKTDDMTPDKKFDGKFSERANFAWFWNPAGETSCVVLIFTFDAFGECALPDKDEALDGGNGVALDFGPLGPGNGYYYTDADLQANALGWTLPTGQGAYFFQMANDDGGGNLSLAADPCQIMEWGTGDAGGTVGGAGTQGELAWNDDTNPDGEQTEDECYTYAGWAPCPDPAGGMIQFWVDDAGEPDCYADCNLDGKLDLFDFLCFVNFFNAGNEYADCNGDNAHDLFDFLCFVNAFNLGCD